MFPPLERFIVNTRFDDVKDFRDAFCFVHSIYSLIIKNITYVHLVSENCNSTLIVMKVLLTNITTVNKTQKHGWPLTCRDTNTTVVTRTEKKINCIPTLYQTGRTLCGYNKPGRNYTKRRKEQIINITNKNLLQYFGCTVPMRHT